MLSMNLTKKSPVFVRDNHFRRPRDVPINQVMHEPITERNELISIVSELSKIDREQWRSPD